ncbi:hypothetical protein [Escherichia coli]|nr:hypothetical protein [Escherichia coli]
MVLRYQLANQRHPVKRRGLPLVRMNYFALMNIQITSSLREKNQDSD